MKKTSNNKYLFAVLIIMSLNPVRTAAQSTYSGSYSIQIPFQEEYRGGKINGTAKYNYVEMNEQRIYHGPFKFSTTLTTTTQDPFPDLIWLPTDSITIIGLFNYGQKNGLWTIKGYRNDGYSTNYISIEMTYDNGVLDGLVKGSSSHNANEICSFDYSFSKGKLNGPFRIAYNGGTWYGSYYTKINCLINFTDGLFDGNNTVSFFTKANKEFKLLRQYDHGLLYLDKFQDQSTGEYILNKKYNIDFSLPDFNYTNYNNHFADFADKYLRGSEQLIGYKDYFSLLTEISKGTANELPFVGYFYTKNSEIFSLNERDTIDRVVNNRNHNVSKSYHSDKDKFIRETSPKDLWSNIYLDRHSYSVGQTAFVDIPINLSDEENNLTIVYEYIFSLFKLIYIFPVGQDNIEIKPIKVPYLFVSQEVEELYNSYRIEYLYLDSINRFKQDSIKFRQKILEPFGSLNSNQKILSSQFSFYYFHNGYEDKILEAQQTALAHQFQEIKKIDEEISDQSNFNFSSVDLRIKQDSILHHYKELQIRLELLNKILSLRDNSDLLRILSPDGTTASLKFLSQIQKLLEIPGANERFSDDRQFTFRPDQSTEDELNEILLIINERNEVYSKIYKNEIRVNPKKYATIDEFVTDLKAM